MKKPDILFLAILAIISICIILTITRQYQIRQVNSAKTLEQQIIDRLKEKDSWQKTKDQIKDTLSN